MKSDRALIFDLDGTLWDTVALCALAWNRAIAASGLSDRLGNRLGHREILPQDVRAGMGLAADDLRAQVFPELDVKQGAELLRACFEQEIAALNLRDPRDPLFFEGVLEGIPRLAAAHELYVVSNCDAPYLEAFFQVSKLGPYFRDAECHGNTGRPKGENIRTLARRNSLQKAIYVGDTIGDQKAAEFAEVPFIFARYGFGNCTRHAGVIDSFTELERELARDF